MGSGINPETGMSYRFKDRVGDKVGRLTYIKYLGPDKHKHSLWLCKCDCGNEVIPKSHKTKSCGCIRSEMMADLGRSSKKSNPYSRTKEYRRELKKKLRSRPEYVMHERISRLHRHALSQVGSIKESPTFNELGYSVSEFVAHIERQFLEGMSWDNMSEWQIDHIIPISTATCKNDVIALNQLSNLRPMWASENNKKKNKIETLL